MGVYTTIVSTTESSVRQNQEKKLLVSEDLLPPTLSEAIITTVSLVLLNRKLGKDVFELHSYHKESQ